MRRSMALALVIGALFWIGNAQSAPLSVSCQTSRSGSGRRRIEASERVCKAGSDFRALRLHTPSRKRRPRVTSTAGVTHSVV
jgi:hypothetical protein